MRIPVIRSITDLARDAKGLVEQARQSQEPIVITQRGREAAVLVPIELYRRMEVRPVSPIGSPRLVNPQDAGLFTKTMTVERLEIADGESAAGL